VIWRGAYTLHSGRDVWKWHFSCILKLIDIDVNSEGYIIPHIIVD